MAKKPKSAPSAAQPPQEPLFVLTTRLTTAERDQVRAAAGWGGVQRFVHDAVMTAVDLAQRRAELRVRKPSR